MNPWIIFVMGLSLLAVLCFVAWIGYIVGHDVGHAVGFDKGWNQARDLYRGVDTVFGTVRVVDRRVK